MKKFLGARAIATFPVAVVLAATMGAGAASADIGELKPPKGWQPYSVCLGSDPITGQNEVLCVTTYLPPR